MDKRIVLLVEDDAQEAVKATKILRGHGFKVMIATNLTEALEYSRMLEGKLSGIVTDLDSDKQRSQADCRRASESS